MQNYAYNPRLSKAWILWVGTFSLFLSTSSFSQSIEEVEAIRQKQTTEESARKAAAEREAANRRAAQAVATYALTINTVPTTAKVSIRNIEPKYHDGMRLPAGQYQVRVEAAGYETEEKWVGLGKAAKTLTIKLEAKPKPAAPTTVQIPTPPPVRPANAISTRLPFEPVMMPIPAGSFTMGCVEGRDDINRGGCQADEKPPHTVSLPAFQIGKYEVTFDEWDACEHAKACPHAEDEGWGRGKHPVINVSWNDITQKYLPWLSQQTGKHYRLPTEAEWEYAARAGSKSAYPWGNTINCSQANYGYYKRECNNNRTQVVGSYDPNIFDLYDIAGNVWEWAKTPHTESYQSLEQGLIPVIRGGSWAGTSWSLRLAYRGRTMENRMSSIGFRVALDV